MKEDKQIEFISTAQVEIDNIHDPVSFLEQVQSLFPLLSLDKLDSWIVQLAKDDRNFIFRDAKLLVIVLVEGVVFVECASLWTISASLITSLWISFLDSDLVSWSQRSTISLCPIFF